MPGGGIGVGRVAMADVTTVRRFFAQVSVSVELLLREEKFSYAEQSSEGVEKLDKGPLHMKNPLIYLLWSRQFYDVD